MREEHYIEIEGNTYKYYLLRCKVRNVTLHYEKNGEWLIKANNYVPIDFINQFIKDEFSKIIKKQQNFLHKQSITYTGLNNDYFYYFGKKYQLVLLKDHKNYVEILDDMIVHYKDYDKIDQTIKLFMKKEVEKRVNQAILKYHAILDDYRLLSPKLTVRFMTSRWGSCSSKAAKISMSAYLIHYDQQFLEYVTIHELAHFVQPNHSKKFYEVVEFYEPNYKEMKDLYQKI